VQGRLFAAPKQPPLSPRARPFRTGAEGGAPTRNTNTGSRRERGARAVLHTSSSRSRGEAKGVPCGDGEGLYEIAPSLAFPSRIRFATGRENSSRGAASCALIATGACIPVASQPRRHSSQTVRLFSFLAGNPA
jgi:hypothetical protein